MNKLHAEVALLCMRKAVADKEFYTAAANRELTQFGAWNCDWYQAIGDAQKCFDEAFKSFEKANNE